MTTVVANGIAHHVQRLPAREPTGAGPAPVALLAHGLVTDSLASYYFTLGPTFAAAGLDVVMYDLRGHGRSACPRTGYRLADFVADLDALLDALQLRVPVHLVGNSFGGTVAFAYAERRPERVVSLAMIESEPATSAWAAKMAATLTTARDRLSRHPGVIDRLADSHGARPTRLARRAARLLRSTSLAGDLPAGELLSGAPIAAMAVPTLAVYGGESDLAGQAGRLAAMLPRCTTVVVPGQGHRVLVNRPVLLGELILTWLREHDSAVLPVGKAQTR